MDFKKYPLLSCINKPSDLRSLDYKELDSLCGEIRSLLIENVERSGGHLASNLGVVELTVALHRVLDLPRDKIVFDVGHQCYTHKLLTGRKELFDTLRSPGGLSGFTKRSESDFDPFGAGHSSTSVSAAIGLATADKYNGNDAVTVALLGDGAFTGGIVHEALNNIPKDLPLIIILNENEMSISKNTGAFASYIAKIRNSGSYFRAKKHTRNALSVIPLIGKPLVKGLTRSKQFLKNALYSSNYFEDMGLFYVGPVDGHDIQTLEGAIKEAVSRRCGVIIHVKTVKGKGMAEAENAPDLYHSVRPKAKSVGKNPSDEITFSEKFGEIICQKAENDKKIFAITAAMADGCGLNNFEAAYPDRFFDVGIAEEHAAIFAAGLAAGGVRPVFAVYSTFLQRAYDCVLHDVALQDLPVIFAVDRAGIAAADGPTHHGIFDVSFLSGIPRVQIWSPYDFESMEEAFESAWSTTDRPVCIRYPSGKEFSGIGEALPRKCGSLRLSDTDPSEADGVIITYGRIAAEAIKAKNELEKDGKKILLIVMNKLRPYNDVAEGILSLLDDREIPVVFLEEGIRSGGASENLYIIMKKNPKIASKSVKILAIDEPFKALAKGMTAYENFGIGAPDVVRAVSDN